MGEQFVLTQEGFAVVAMQANDEGVAVATLSGIPEVKGRPEEKPAEEKKKSTPSLDKY